MSLRDEQSALDPTEVLNESQLPAMLMRFMEQMTKEFLAGGSVNPVLLAEQFSPVQRSQVLTDLILHHLELRTEAGQSPQIEDYAGQLSPADLPLLQRVFAMWRAAMRESAGSETPADRDISSKRISGGSFQVQRPQRLEVQELDGTAPAMIGTVRIEGVLGRGGFGQVLLGFDTELAIYVAVKLPRQDLPNLESACNDLIQEAIRAEQVTNGLRDCGVVRVRKLAWHNKVPAIVMDVVDGPDLGRVLKSRGGRLPPQEAVGLLKQLCRVLQLTHEKNCIHRDLKPQNLLLDERGVLWLTDFGLAQQEWERRTTDQLEGTIPYMSPEQWQGERLDGRTDVWSLGVIMYQMLSGQRPFQEPDIGDKIRTASFAPLKQRDGQLPKRLELICNKCLQKLLTQRYGSVADILEDLEIWERSLISQSGATELTVPLLAEAPSESRDLSVPPVLESASGRIRPRPRGLQSYGPEDEQFFLRLLPGDVEPDGLPESLHFWRAGRGGVRSDGDMVGVSGPSALRLKSDFRVGVIHGRSGCGKSSFLKAGLLPRLAADVKAVYLAATADRTEQLLLQKLCELYPQLPQNGSLSEVFRQLRDRVLPATGSRLLIVLDQFEQWLDQHVGESTAELTASLRHAEGGCLQVLLVVREEFWSPTQEFMLQLDESLDTGRNDQMLHLFSEQHARRVLIWFGQWYQRLPEEEQAFGESQHKFLEAAVSGLSSGGRVVPVRLAVFCEMFRGQEWTLSEFERLGGTEAIERRFLRDQFSSADAPQKQRQHLRAAMLVLELLLPATGSEIRGHSRSRTELFACSGYQRKPKQFAELLEILEADLKLVTRVEQPDGDGVAEQAETHYMLTHDFLVNSIRPWVEEELLRTAAGRAEMVLKERTMMWSGRRESRFLPGVFEDLRIRWYLRSREKTPAQQLLLRASSRLHLLRGSLLLVVLAAVLLLAAGLQRKVEQARAESLAGGIARLKTTELATGLVPLQLLREYALPTLQKLYREPGNPPEALLHLAIARLQLGDADPELLPTARDRALECRPEQMLPLTKLLQPWAATLQPELRQITQDQQQAANARLHAACLLAAWEPADGPDTAWSQPATAEFVAAQVAAQNPVFVGAYQEVLRPQAGRLTAPLAKFFADPAQTEVARTIVTGLLADYAKDNVPFLAELLLEADPAADKLLFPLLEADRAKAISEFQDVLDLELAIDWADPPLNPAWLEPSEALRSQLEGAKGVLHDRFALCLDLRLSQLLLLCENLRPSGYRPIRMRPFAGDISDDPRMVAVWARDGNHFQVQTAVPAVELPRTGDNAIREGVLLSELVMIPGTGPKSGWLMVWGDPPLEGEERRCMAGVTLQELAEGRDSLARSNFTVRKSIYVFNDASGERRYTGIFASAGFPGISIEGPLTSAVIDQRPHVDISLAEPWIDVRANLPLRLVTAKDKLDAMPENHASLLEYAKLCWFAGDDIVAIKSLNLLWEQGIRTEELLRFRVFVLARLNRVEEANLCLEEYKRSAATERARFFVEVISAAFLGAETEALTLVEQRLQQTSTDEHLVIAGACAVASGGCARYPEGLRRLREKSLSIIEQTLAVQPYRVAEIIDYDFEALQNESRYRAFFADRRFVVLLAEDPETNTMLLSAPSLQVMQDQVLLATQSGWRPSAVCVGSEGREVHLIVRQPLIEDARKEALAIRQGAAAVALLRLGAAGTVWPLLESRPDPRLRSEILHRLSLYGVDGRAFMTQLTAESGSADPAVVSRRRSLIQGLGELAAAKLLPPPLVAEATADLLVRFTQDPDSGVHGMCEWTLRQLGAAEQMLQAEQQFRTGDAVDGRRWYLTKTGGNDPADRGLSFAIINATEPFVMGSPLSEAERFGGPAGQDERRHRRQIGRVVAIGMHEVTVSQFLKFRRQHDFIASYSPTADSPMNTVSWYDAAAFCNWLSEQEGLDASQWCYEPGEQGYSEGMRIKPNFAELQGYRLPTEAEWERVCRADTVTSRYFGETDRLLGTYAWYTKNSGDESMQPVSTLRPNGAGAFGLYGNAFEWCMDVGQFYSSEVSVSADLGQGGQVSEVSSRVLRGGSFLSNATIMRSANRNGNRPGNRNLNYGFRVSRTYYLRP